MRQYLEEIKDFPKKGDTFLLVLCLIISGFGLVCIASATSAEKFDGNFRYIALQSFAVLMGVVAYIMFSSVDLDMLSEHRGLLVAFNCILLLMLIPFGDDMGSGNRSWLRIPGLPFNIQPAGSAKSPTSSSWLRSCRPTRIPFPIPSPSFTWVFTWLHW